MANKGNQEIVIKKEVDLTDQDDIELENFTIKEEMVFVDVTVKEEDLEDLAADPFKHTLPGSNTLTHGEFVGEPGNVMSEAVFDKGENVLPDKAALSEGEHVGPGTVKQFDSRAYKPGPASRRKPLSRTAEEADCEPSTTSGKKRASALKSSDGSGQSQKATLVLGNCTEIIEESPVKRRIWNPEYDARRRRFRPEWEMEFFMVANKTDILCLICRTILTSPKKWNVKRHYDKLHKEYDVLFGDSRELKLEELKEAFLTECNKLEIDLGIPRGRMSELPYKSKTPQTQKEDQKTCEKKPGRKAIFQDSPATIPTNKMHLTASYEVALRIAKAAKPFTSGGFVKDCLVAAALAICPQEVESFEKINVSPLSIGKRLLEMGDNVKGQLKLKIAKFIACSVAIDESTNIADTPHLAIFIRGVDRTLNVTEELLDFCLLKGRTTGQAMLETVENSFKDMLLPWNVLKSVASDGAAIMSGKNSTFSSLLAKKICADSGESDVVFVHSIVHQAVIFARKIDAEQVLPVVVRAVNFIRLHGSNNEKFKPFLEVNPEQKDMPYHSVVLLLSNGILLKKFFEVRDDVKMLTIEKNRAIEELDNEGWVASLAFLVDLTAHLSELHHKLQCKGQLAPEMWENIKTFQKDLILWRDHLDNWDFEYFPSLASLPKDKRGNIASFSSTLENLHEELNSRLSPFWDLQPEFAVFSDPFSPDISKAPTHLKNELLLLQSDTNLKGLHSDSSIVDFYKNIHRLKFPLLHALAAKVLCLFGGTCIFEQFFSSLNVAKAEYRSRISDKHLNATIRLAVMQDLKPDLVTLVNNAVE